MVAIIARVLLKEKFSFLYVLAMLFTIGGVVLIAKPSFIFKSASYCKLNFFSFVEQKFKYAQNPCS